MMYLYPLFIYSIALYDNTYAMMYHHPLIIYSIKPYTSDTEAAFLDLHLSISYDIISTKVYDKRDDFDFEIVNFPFLDSDILSLHPMESISLNSFVLLEHLSMLLTSTLAIIVNSETF